MAAPPPAPPSRFQRLRQFFRDVGRRNTILANIGEGAHDVIVGNYILKIGTLTIPALPVVIAVIVTLLAGAFTLWIYVVPTTMPPEYFNVAIAEFSAIDEQGRETVSEDSALISKTLFATIDAELAELPPDYQALVWHDSMSLLQKRTTIGAITSTGSGDRSDAACRRAEAVGADLIVYGLLDTRPTPATLQLQFCVRQAHLLERDMGSLDELQKADRLGSPLRLQLPLRDVKSSVNPDLRARTSLVARLIVGLRYELADNTNFQSSLRRALDVFAAALDDLEREYGSPTRENGGDMVLYFAGRENFFLAQDQATPPDQRSERLNAAQQAFQAAVDLNPQFARAHTALGSTYFLRAQQRPPADRFSTEDLARAIAAYTAAISAAQTAQDAPAEAEARLALALTYRLQAESFLFQAPSDVSAATNALAAAEQQVTSGVSIARPSEYRLRGFAAMVLAFIAEQRAQTAFRAADQATGRAMLQEAQKQYEQCIAAGAADPGDQFLHRQIITATCAPREQIVAQRLQQAQP